MKKIYGIVLTLFLVLGIFPVINAHAEEGFIVSFNCNEGVSFVAYDRQNFENAIISEKATYAIARDSETGEVDLTGNGQVNFVITVNEGFAFDSIDITEGTENYKNLKLISEEENVYTYRITKITGNLAVSVKTIRLDSEGARELLVSELKSVMNSYPKYYLTYCTAESADVLTNALNNAKTINTKTATNEEIEVAITAINSSIADLRYKTAEVPQVYISTENGKGNSLSKSKGYVNTDVVIADTDGKILAGSGEIKVRGNSTAYAEKKPYNIKFFSKQDVLGMGNAKKWCLLANCFDPTLLRNSIALNIAHKMELQYTSENCFVEVWMDGVFKGCFLLAEAVEAGDTRVDIKVKKGDFMLELEKSRVEEGTTYITNANGIRFSFKEPEEPTAEQFDYVKSVLDRITAVIDSGDFSEVEKVIDTESFAKFLVLNEYMKNVDFNFSSVNFYYKDGKLYAGPAWDFDLSCGNGDEKYPDNRLYDTPKARYANWYPYLFKYYEFQKLVIDTLDRYKGFLSGIPEENGYIDTMVKQYGVVFARNFNEAGWDVSKKYSSNEMTPFATYEENVAFIKNWLINRLSWMDSYYHSNNFIPHVWIDSTSVEEDYVNITWKEVGGVDGYRVYRREADTWKAISGVISGNSYDDYKAEVGKEYYYDVVGVIDGVRGSNDKTGNYVYVHSKNPVELIIVKQPENIVLDALNKRVTFSVEASGKGLSYMWYFRSPGSEQIVKSNVTEKQYSRYISAETDGLEVACVITDIYGVSVTTDIVSATSIKDTPEIVILEDTADIVAKKVGEKYSFRIEAEGTNLKYSWYYKRPGDEVFYKAGVYTNEYTRTYTEKINGMQAYCVITDAAGKKVTGRIATLAKVESRIDIITDTADIFAKKAGEKCVFSIEAEGAELKYSWYYKRPGDEVFYKAGAYTNEYCRTYVESIEGMQVYCVVTDCFGNSIKGRTATLSLLKNEVEILYPLGTELVVPYGKKINFTIEVNSTAELSYKWYYKLPASSNGDIVFHNTGCYSNVYTRTATSSIDGMQAYCVVTDSEGKKTKSETFTFILE